METHQTYEILKTHFLERIYIEIQRLLLCYLLHVFFFQSLTGINDRLLF